MSEMQVMVVRSELESLDTLCHGIVTRGGEEDACSKPAAAVIWDRESASIWPACIWHANRFGGALTLGQVSEALRWGATSFEREVPDGY